MPARVYDERFLEHGVSGPPEHAGRLRAVVARLRASDLWEEIAPLEFAPATAEQLQWVHEPAYLEELEGLSHGGGGPLDPDTLVTAHSWEAATLAAGRCISAAEALLEGSVEQVVCLVRPPGHHALPHRGKGFCLLNNPALAAEAARRAGAQRVALLDWDAHHGNGLQDFFYHRGDVFYLSLHAQHLFPGTGTSDELGREPLEADQAPPPLPAAQRLRLEEFLDHGLAQHRERLGVRT